MQPKRIAICCDFLMTRPVTQKYHLRWFETVIKRSLSLAVSTEYFSFISDEDGRISRAQFFELSGIKLDATETHFHFNPDALSQNSVDLVRDELSGCLLIGYELSEETRAVLDRAGVTYIDVWLHPIRFMDDNFFAYRSNSRDIDESIASYHLDEDVYYLYADKLKIQSYMGWDRYGGHLDKYLVPDSALFIGQTLTDKAVCREGKMLNVLDFKEEFLDVAARHEHVYFSRHPLLVGGDEEQINFVNTVRNATLIEEPGYKLLTAEAIKTVFAVSSSMVYESKFFGKNSTYLFRPVVPIRQSRHSDGYASVFGKLHSPSFWRDILKSDVPVCTTVTDYDFLKPHSNYRDMLALYYNTDVFDKEHSVFKRSQEVKIAKPSRSTAPTKGEKSDGYELNVINFDRVKKHIDEHKVISFDVFDTLLQRRVNVAGDVIKLVAKTAFERFGIDEQEFLKSRREAKLHSDKVEVPLEERYSIVGRLLNLDPSVSEALFAIELDYENSLLHERTMGKLLFLYAKAKGKRVIVTSDTYFDQVFVAEALSREGIVPDAFYLSRDYDATKEAGPLFASVISSEGLDILHIGDNKKADYTNARAAGISAVWLISNKEQATRSSPKFSLVPGANGYLATLQNGLIVNNLTRYPAITRDAGYTQGAARDLGFNVFGDMILAFAAWIILKAKQDGIHKIFFLARDGEIAKRAVDAILTQTDDHEISTEYLLASRRCVRVIALRASADVNAEVTAVLDEIRKNKFPAKIGQYLSLRFGLPVTEIESAGLPLDISDVSLESFLRSDRFVEAVLKNSVAERELYSRYLDEVGFPNNSGEKVAVVDIGHNGTLQASLCKIRGLNCSHGYYFATYQKVDEVLAGVQGEHKSSGFYRDRASSSNRDDLYIRYALMIEALFLNDKGTFLRFTKEGEKLTPNYLAGDSERRYGFNRALHSGALDYINSLISTSKACFGKVDLEYLAVQKDVCARYFAMLRLAAVRDARTFSSITFENFFSGKELRYLVPPASALDKPGIWREGTKALAVSAKPVVVEKSKKKPSASARERFVLASFWPILNRHLSTNERKSYKDDPRKLFEKSKHPVMRFVGAAAGLRKYRKD